MIKLKSSMLLTAAAAALLVSSVYAGGPTVEPAQPCQHYDLFATAEGGYTWNQFGSTTLNYNVDGAAFNSNIQQTNSGGTGRVAFGIMYNSSSVTNLNYTAEIGGGYYGQTQYQSNLGGLINAQNYVYGLDILAGLDYQFDPMFDVFFKLGGLIQDVRMVRNTNLTGLGVNVTENTTTTTSSVAPEIKLGGVYNLTSVWGLSASYLHVFGNNVSTSLQKTIDGQGIVTGSNYSATGTPVSLNTVLFGVQYKFS